MARTIFHVDMDAFYASVEQRDNRLYRGKPVIVGADPRSGSGRGVVAACSYEARRYGIHSALPISTAYRLCPRGIYVRPDMAKYREVSRQIRSVFHGLTELVEPLSIDEAFLDVSTQVKNDASALELAKSLKREISERHRLSASVGIAPNKFIAKIASDLKKPDGLVQVRAHQIQEFLDPLPIGCLWGVGPRKEDRLRALGITRIEELRRTDRSILVREFGKAGDHLWNLSSGVDNRPVVTSREPKSLGHEHTFSEDVLGTKELESALRRMCESISARLQRLGLAASTVTLKLRYADFTTFTRQTSLPNRLSDSTVICEVASALFLKNRDPRRRVRLIGVSVSGLGLPASSYQLRLF